MKTAEQALLEVLNIVRRYLPPDGINVKDAMSEIIACVDPWPLVPTQPPAASQPVIAATVKRWCETCEGTGYVFQEPQAGCHVGGDHPCPDCDGKGYWTPAQPPAASQPNEEGEREIIATYNALHANKLGAHWLWVVIEQIAAGVPEDEAFKSFGYYEAGPSRSRWDATYGKAVERSEQVGPTIKESLTVGAGELVEVAKDAEILRALLTQYVEADEDRLGWTQCMKSQLYREALKTLDSAQVLPTKE